MNNRPPSCYVIAGPNGAGKTTFALRYLPEITGCRKFINADLIADAIARRYGRTVSNFLTIFSPLCDEIMCYDNSETDPVPVFSDCAGERTVLDNKRLQMILESSHG